MKFLCCLLAASLLFPTPNAQSQETLAFAAQIEDENLAEEAILLLHCLSTRTDRPWEFTGDARGEAWLKVQEKNHRLEGVYHVEGKDRPFELTGGDSDAVCEKLEHAGAKPDLAPPSLAPLEALPSRSGERKTWLWVGLGIVAVAGFFFWKSRQPAYKEIQMN